LTPKFDRQTNKKPTTQPALKLINQAYNAKLDLEKLSLVFDDEFCGWVLAPICQE